jgi:uroporphyrinogen-III synthase
VRLLCGDQVEIAVFLTGVGVQTIIEGARRLGCEAELLVGLGSKRIAVRGPKAQNAIRRLGLSADVCAPEPFTSTCLLETMARTWELHDRHVLVQRYGAPVPALVDGLRALGARVYEVSPYRWERPLDEEAVVRLLEDLAAGWIDVLAATNAAQVDHLFDIARERGYEAELRRALATRRLRVAAQGIVCASAFARRGIDVDVMPPRASMGAMVVEIARSMQTDPPAQAAEPDETNEVIAMLFAGPVDAQRTRRVVAELPATATLAVLSGRSRAGERLAEQVAVERGLAVHSTLPTRSGRHPAETLVRRADRVVIVTGDGAHTGLGTLLQLAERYAKPARVVRGAASTRLGG